MAQTITRQRPNMLTAAAPTTAYDSYPHPAQSAAALPSHHQAPRGDPPGTRSVTRRSGEMSPLVMLAVWLVLLLVVTGLIIESIYLMGMTL